MPMNEGKTMTLHQEASQAVLNYALIKAGDERFKYAYAYGMVFALLTDEQKEYLKNYASNGVSHA